MYSWELRSQNGYQRLVDNVLPRVIGHSEAVTQTCQVPFRR